MQARQFADQRSQFVGSQLDWIAVLIRRLQVHGAGCSIQAHTRPRAVLKNFRSLHIRGPSSENEDGS